MNESKDPTSSRRDPLTLLTAMARTRLELASLDVQAHLTATFASFAFGFAAVVVALIALAFAGIAVIAAFWDLHRVLAAALVTAAYLIAAWLLGLRARAAWRSRPDPLAAMLHEIELDREAVREAA
jgi:uncharacterized membrane protein YqjE